jgi:phosphoglycerate dehydrogenase-like enzyme
MEPRLVARVFPPDVLHRLHRVVHLPSNAIPASLAEPAGVDHLAEVEILLTGWGCPIIDGAVLDQLPRLRAIVHAAGTVKHHLGPAVFDRGISVSSATAANAVPVAEYTVAVLVLAAKRAFSYARSYTLGEPALGQPPGEDAGLCGTTVGIIGASRIGRLVIERLAGFEVHVLVADPHLDPDAAARLGAELVEVDELCRQSDLVSVHAPELPETHHLLDARRLALLRDGAVVVNTARGSLVDTDALTSECAAGRLSAVLDVTSPEPLPRSHPLLHLPNAFVTPHVAGSRGRELRRLGEFAVAEVERLVRGEPLHGAVREVDLQRIA